VGEASVGGVVEEEVDAVEEEGGDERDFGLKPFGGNDEKLKEIVGA
jgi:hypothetical protein